MKRQLGPMLIVLALLCAPVAWSQSSSTDSSSSDSTQSGAAPVIPSDQPPATFTPSKPANPPSGFTPNPAIDSSSSNPSQSGSTQKEQSGQSGSGDTAQSGGGGGGGDTLSGGAGDSPQQITGPQPAFTHPEQLPALSSLNEVTANTGMQLSVFTGISSDSNASGGGYSTTWLGLGSVAGTFGITQIRPKINWSLNYGGGTQVPLAGSSNYPTLVTQTGTANVLWQIAQRWQLTLADSYYYSSDPFQPFLTITSLPTFNDPNPTVYVPQATTQGNTGTVALTYQLGAHDTINVSGFENFLRYQQSYQSLQNSYTWAGSAFYQHQFSEKLALGGGYSLAALDFGHGQSRAGVQTFQGFVSYQINAAMSVSGWVGPELTHTKDIVPYICLPGYGCLFQVVHEQSFNVAEGANFSWVGSHSSFRAKFSHQVTNGGGQLGVVKLYYFSADYVRPLSARWTLSGAALYGNNVSLSAFHENQYLNSITAQVGVSRHLNQSWAINAYYAVVHQHQMNVIGYSTPTFLDNRIAFLLQYNWGHSLGR